MSSAEIYQFPASSGSFEEYWEEINDMGSPISLAQAKRIFHMTPEQYFENAGWVYVLQNPMLPKDVFKVGRTTGAIQRRMRQLFTTGLPSQFELASARWCRDCVLVERITHEKLSNYRVSDSREFFKCDLDDINRAINYANGLGDPTPDHMIDLMFSRWNYATKTETVNGKLVVERQPAIDPNEVPF